MDSTGRTLTTIRITLVLSLIALSGCSQPNAPSPAAKARLEPLEPSAYPAAAVSKIEGPIPAPLIAADKSAAEIFNTARDGNWSFGPAEISSLEQSLSQLRTSLQPVISDRTAGQIGSREDEMDSNVSLIRDSVQNKHRSATLSESNRIDMLLADIAGMYAEPVPGELMRLRCYSREFGLAASTDDRPAVVAAAEGIRTVWQELRPTVEANGGSKEAQNFSDLVANLEQCGPAGELPALLGNRITEIEAKLPH